MMRQFSEQHGYKLLVLLVLAANISTGAASVLIGLCTLLLLAGGGCRRRLTAEDRSLARVFVVYFALQAIAAACSLQPAESFRAIAAELHRILPLLFPLAFLRTQAQLRYLLLAFVFLLAVNHIYGLYQYIILHQRASGFCHSPTFYGSFLLMCTPVTLFAATRDILRPLERRIALAVSLSGLPMLLLSETRGAWIAFVGVCAFFVLLSGRHRRRIVQGAAVALLCFGLLVAVLPGMTARLSTLGDPNYQSNSERRYMWAAAVQFFEAYPLTGVGQEQYGPLYNGPYFPPDAKERGHGHPHNIFLKVLSEEGLLGMLVFFLLHGYFLLRFYRLHRAARGQGVFTFGMMGMLSLVGLLLEGMTDTNMNQVPIMREYWIIAGITLVSARILAGESPDMDHE